MLLMKDFVKKITEWVLDKEELMAKSCAIPLNDVDHQLEQIKEQKEKLQKDYDASMAVFNDITERLEKIKNIEILRCQKKGV